MWERWRLWCHSDILTLPVQDNNTLENSSDEFLRDAASFCQNKLWTTSNKSSTSGVLRASRDLTCGLYYYCSESGKNTDGNVIRNISLPYGIDSNILFFTLLQIEQTFLKSLILKSRGSHMFRLAVCFFFVILHYNKNNQTRHLLTDNLGYEQQTDVITHAVIVVAWLQWNNSIVLSTEYNSADLPLGPGHY